MVIHFISPDADLCVFSFSFSRKGFASGRLPDTDRIPKSVEFRQHSGTTNFTKMENWIRFLNGLITFAKRSSLPSRMTLEGLPFLDGKQKLFFKLRTKKLAV